MIANSEWTSIRKEMIVACFQVGLLSHHSPEGFESMWRVSRLLTVTDFSRFDPNTSWFQV